MENIFLLIGGNLGNRKANLQGAVNAIEQQCGSVIAQSSLYETAPWGVENQPNYLNKALQLECSLDPTTLMERLLKIENEFGRTRKGVMGARTLDIDILIVENKVIKNEILEAPHPRLHQRKFALIPLAEIAPNLLHPILKKTIKELLRDCEDTLAVEKIDE